jgi:catecholate siderophore receptor
LRSAFVAGTSLGLLHAVRARAQEAPTAPARDRTAMQEVDVFGRQDQYGASMSSLAKLAAPPMETPQSIATVTSQVLEDRAAFDLNEALHNAPGITIGAGEFKSMGNSPTIRGFVARDDMFLDGIRDYGDYYRDPFNLESIEVLEGPSSVLFGRGSTGGVIEQASKLPKLEPAISGTLTGGTDETRRATVDVNEPVSMLGEGAAVRLNLMSHEADVAGRDVATDSRNGFAPSLALGLGTPTRLTLAYFHQHNDDVPDYGLPYLGGRPAPVPRSNFYGFKSDYMRTATDILTLRVAHDFSAAFTLENQLRYADYARDFRFSEPLISTSVPASAPPAEVSVTRNVNAGNSNDTMLWDQLVATVRWEAGGIRNTSVIGLEGGHEKAAPEFDSFSGVPSTALLAPDENQPFMATAAFPRYKTHLTADSAAPFVIDTARLGRWAATLGLRWDHFRVDYADFGFSTTTPGEIVRTDHIPHTDEMASYRAAIAYDAAANGNVYFSFGTSFDPSAEDLSLISSSRSFSLKDANLSPEKNRSFELGTKWTLARGHLDVTGAVFRLEKENARVPDPTDVLLDMLGGAERVDGAEVDVQGGITANWRIIGGYTYLDSEMTRSAHGAAPSGSPLMNTPKHAFTFWTVYRVAPRVELGGGGRFVASQITQNVPPIKTVPGFWEFDAMASYALTTRIAAQLNVKNLFNRYYYDQLHFFHVVPGPGRTALLSVNVRF